MNITIKRSSRGDAVRRAGSPPKSRFRKEVTQQEKPKPIRPSKPPKGYMAKVMKYYASQKKSSTPK